MSYSYRTQQEQNWIKIKRTLQTAANAVKEQLYHFGLLQAPEVRINKQNLPALPARITR
jgi:hypothetical protein